MISVEKFKEIIEDVSFSYIERSFRHPIGWIYETSCLKERNEETLKRAKYVKKIAHKHGLRVSYNMVYSDLEHYDALKTVMNEVVKTMYVSPITWIPTKEFGFNKFCFGFFPYMEKKEFVYSENNSYEEKFDINQDSLNKLVSYRIDEELRSVYKFPIWFDDDIFYPNPKPPRFFILSSLSFHREISTYYADDSIFPEDLTPDEYAKAVLEKLNLLDNLVSEYNILISDDADRMYTAMGYLKQRLNVSSHIIFDSYPALDGDHISFSFDTSRIDKFSKHHDFFRIVNL